MTDETFSQRARLHELIEDALATGLTVEQVIQVVLNAESSLQADRMTAGEDGRSDPYPHLADSGLADKLRDFLRAEGEK